jgi:Ca2+-binding RTX toxin-like protein
MLRARDDGASTVVEMLEGRTLFAGISLLDGQELRVFGGGGNDTIKVSQSGDRIVAQLNSTTRSFSRSVVKRIYLRGEGGNDVITVGRGSVPGGKIDAGHGSDRVTGGPNSDQVIGGPGDDQLSGGGANDHVFGNDGRDTLRGGSGDDVLWGHAGNDVIFGDGGHDDMIGGSGSDEFWGGTGEGGDVRSGFGVYDIVSYEDHTAAVRASLDGVRNDGSASENDWIHSDVEGVRGGAGNDTLTGSARSDLLDGGGGNDTVRGLGGDDELLGGLGGDLVDGGDGNDYLTGGAHTDGDGNDTILGGAGYDLLQDTHGDDSLRGGDGDDELHDRLGNNTLEGGAGIDEVNGRRDPGGLSVTRSGDGRLLVIAASDLPDIFEIRPISGNRLQFKDITVSLDGVTEVHVLARGGDDSITMYPGSAVALRIDGGTGRDTLGAGDGPAVLVGGAGNDELHGGPGEDRLFGGAGNDLLVGGGGRDALHGDDGDDSLRARGDGFRDFLSGGLGTDSAEKDPEDEAVGIERLV